MCPEAHAQWIDHFYLDPAVWGQDIGLQALRQVMNIHRDGRPFRLAVSCNSAARRLCVGAHVIPQL